MDLYLKNMKFNSLINYYQKQQANLLVPETCFEAAKNLQDLNTLIKLKQSELILELAPETQKKYLLLLNSLNKNYIFQILTPELLEINGKRISVLKFNDFLELLDEEKNSSEYQKKILELLFIDPKLNFCASIDLQKN